MKIVSVKVQEAEGFEPDEKIHKLHVEMDDGHVYFLDAENIPDLAEINNNLG